MKIAYVMSRFPTLSETFILREMEVLSEAGVDIALYPLIIEDQEVMHSEVHHWLAQARRVPYLSGRGTAHALGWLMRRPGTVVSSFWQAVVENSTSPKFLARAMALYPKALDAASRMQREGVEHIHAHFATHSALFAWFIHRLTGIPYSITVHAHDIFVERAMLGTKLRDAAFVVSISDFNVDWLARHVGGWIREKTEVIRCGIEPTRYALRREHVSGPIQLVSIGSLKLYKGQAVLVRACSVLKERGVQFHCRIIGDGEERSRLEALIRELGLIDEVTLVGALAQDSVARELRTADVYVQPSIIDATGKMEGIPVAIMEAMATCVPVVATRISGVPELVRDDDTGVLVEPGDVTGLVDALFDLIADDERRVRLSRAAYCLVGREYDVNTNARRLLVAFEEKLLHAAHRSGIGVRIPV